MSQAAVAKVILVGAPNVGKSLLFNYLTGTYVVVSNYPGTTVDIAKGYCRLQKKTYEIIDTPGAYSLIPLTEEEKVTRELLFNSRPDIVLHVIDAKNIRRMLSMTLQLLDAGFPVILVLNIIDEAEAAGMFIECGRLSAMLNIPVLATSAVKKRGLSALTMAIVGYQYQCASVFPIRSDVEKTMTDIGALLTKDYKVNKRVIALLLLQSDEMVMKQIKDEPHYQTIIQQVKQLSLSFQHPLAFEIEICRHRMIDDLVNRTVSFTQYKKNSWRQKAETWTREPLTGIPILLLVIYFGLYQFVGIFGAGFLVDYFNHVIFSGYLNPILEQVITAWTQTEWLQSMLIGDYGIITLGFRYAVVIVLPIVGTFFLAFAVLEDCGYLPRLAMLTDCVLIRLGLNGRAVIPLVLGLGCGTMAAVVTRTLETKRERLIATFLLALTNPCSAQLGVVLAILSHNVRALLLWGGFLLCVFIFIGHLTATVLPGEKSAFYMELPPLRTPVFMNILTKAGTRLTWYFLEILPVFILTSIFLWACDRTGLLLKIISAVEPVMSSLGLPAQTARVFLLGFFRRDYGAAGLYDLCLNNILDDSQLLIAAVAMTLFVPCIAQFAVMLKERGMFVTVLMTVLIMIIAWAGGKLMYLLVSLFPNLIEMSL